MSRIDERLDWGDVEITPATEYYHFHPGDVIDAEPVVARCVAAAEQAIDDRYRGLRTVVDVTPMARTPEQRDALARLEYLVDQEMAAPPYAALCGYDTGQLSTAAAENWYVFTRSSARGRCRFGSTPIRTPTCISR
jgi:hypothetical protein